MTNFINRHKKNMLIHLLQDIYITEQMIWETVQMCCFIIQRNKKILQIH